MRMERKQHKPLSALRNILCSCQWPQASLHKISVMFGFQPTVGVWMRLCVALMLHCRWKSSGTQSPVRTERSFFTREFLRSKVNFVLLFGKNALVKICWMNQTNIYLHFRPVQINKKRFFRMGPCCVAKQLITHEVKWLSLQLALSSWHISTGVL